MDKKKILFVIEALGAGGAEKALISLMHYIDYSKYDVDLQLFFNTGINLKYLPKEVNLLPPLVADKKLVGKAKLKEDIKNKRYGYVLKKAYYAFLSRVVYRSKGRQGIVLKWQAEISDYKKKNTKHYDVAIGYMQGPPTYYVRDCVDSKRKYCWFHNEYSERLRCDMEEKYFADFDKVLTISPVCVEALCESFPKLNNVGLMYNMNSPELISTLAEEFVPDEYSAGDEIRLLTVGRLSYQKGINMAVDAASILKNKGYKFKWYVLGDGKERKDLEAQIKENGLEDYFFLMGLRDNPYPYIKNADVMVQTSRYEGKSIVLDEAKILGKPIVCTEYSSVYDQLEHLHNAVLTPINPKGIADGVEKMILNQTLMETIASNLEKENASNRGFELKILDDHYKLFEM